MSLYISALKFGFFLQPEWYFTQILTWIRDHRDFLQKRIQPLLNEADLNYIDAVVKYYI